eukprot:CAMPEP_0119321976 /NCGR_PEP_ID=MMETSP1333-20130426/56952_1 /TAXON_ID=418940 /ORGANISM="Scyphosphaera apsteinii, Strain RCC1455" /LENGTH=51 /DNA_ID=CAMNT_0007329087 /DNA_START=1 /DNA_END=152 /DNA_ORIENTATION=-
MQPVDRYGFNVPLPHVGAYRDCARADLKDSEMWRAKWNGLMRQASSGYGGT